MSCPLSEQLTSYLEGRLGPLLESEMRQHLGQCLECRRLHHEFQQISRLLQQMPEQTPCLHSLPVQPSRAWRLRTWLTAAGLTLALGLAGFATRQSAAPPGQLIYQDQNYTVTLQGQDIQLLELTCSNQVHPELRLKFH